MLDVSLLHHSVFPAPGSARSIARSVSFAQLVRLVSHDFPAAAFVTPFENDEKNDNSHVPYRSIG